jgi:hypothetical protein
MVTQYQLVPQETPQDHLRRARQTRVSVHDLGSSPADLSGVCPATGLSWYPLSRSGLRSAPVQALARALVCVAIPVAVLLSRDAKIGRPADEASSQQLAHITEQAALVPAGNTRGPSA